MVNQRDKELFSLLKTANSPLSGEFLGRKLQISRVAIWKACGRLEDFGIQIQRTSKGYFVEETDPIHPLVFPTWTNRLYYAKEMCSTMGQAEKLASEGKVGAIVLAEKQSESKGARDRSWESPMGGLYLSAITLPKRTGMESSLLLGTRFMVSVIKSLHGIGAKAVRFRWPDELYLGDRKVGGLLLQGTGTLGKWKHVIMGLGIRVDLMGISRHRVLKALLPLLDDPDLPFTSEDWRVVNDLRDKVLLLKSGERARAIGLDNSGLLEITAHNKTQELILPGAIEDVLKTNLDEKNFR